jgi:hypothetical protein
MFNYRRTVTVLMLPVFGVLTLFAAAVAIAYLALFFTVKSDRFQEWLKAEIAGRTGYEVTVRDLRLKPPLGIVGPIRQRPLAGFKMPRGSWQKR